MSSERERAALAVGEAIQNAAEKLPDGWMIEITVEHGAGWAELYNPEGESSCDLTATDLNLPESIQEFIRFANAT